MIIWCILSFVFCNPNAVVTFCFFSTVSNGIMHSDHF